MQWYLAPWRNFARFSGRARRREFWSFTVVNWVAMVALFVIDLPLPEHPDDGPILLSGLFCLVILLPTLTVAVRRLHDTNRSAWWLAIAIIPVANLLFLANLAQEGDAGANQYGPEPRALSL